MPMPTLKSTLVALALSATVLAPAAAVISEVAAPAPASATTICVSWYVTGKGMVGKLVFPWSSYPVYLRSNTGGTRTVWVSASTLYNVRVGQYWDTTCGGGGGSWSVTV